MQHWQDTCGVPLEAFYSLLYQEVLCKCYILLEMKISARGRSLSNTRLQTLRTKTMRCYLLTIHLLLRTTKDPLSLAQTFRLKKEIGERLGIAPDEMAAFGDNENDRAMLEFVGHPYLMEVCNPTMENIVAERCKKVEDTLKQFL